MSQKVSLDFTLPELSHALAVAAHDLYGFAMALWLEEDRARQELLDALLVALEFNYFTREMNFSDRLSHKEFRQELFGILYKEAAATNLQAQNRPLELAFYRLSVPERAAAFLKSRTNFSWQEIAAIVALAGEREARVLVERARERLLGRRPKTIEEDLFP